MHHLINNYDLYLKVTYSRGDKVKNYNSMYS